MRTIHIGTRTSQLALWQTDYVAASLVDRWPGLEISTFPVVTKGDRTLHRPLPEIGGKGLFTAELEGYLRSGEIDLAVHSLKDLPVEQDSDLTIGAVLERKHVADVLVTRKGLTLATLAPNAVVGTSSLRRQAQLLSYRKDLHVQSIRGNVDTRIKKVLTGDYDAAVLALAGIERLGLMEHISEILSFDIMLPAPGQGALAVQCRSADQEILQWLRAVDDTAARRTTTAERAFLSLLGGGCSAPIGALATLTAIDNTQNGMLSMRVRALSPDGTTRIESEADDIDPLNLAFKLAEEIRRLDGFGIIEQSAHDGANNTRSDRQFVTMQDGLGHDALAGKRIVVTRAEDQASDMVDELHRRGAIPIILPTIRLEAISCPVCEQLGLLDAPEQHELILHRLDQYDWLIFTSANGVHYFDQWWTAHAKSVGEDERSFRLRNVQLSGCRIAAVGPATARALKEIGLWVDSMPESYLGADIVTNLGSLTRKQVLLPRSALGRPELVRSLTDAGAVVHELALYRPVAAPLSHAQLTTLLDEKVDAITFTSPSTVHSFIESAREASLFDTIFANVTIACIGPTTAQAVTEVGLHAHIVAREHTIVGLIDALDTAFQNRTTY